MQLSSSYYNDRELQIMQKRTHVQSHSVIIFFKIIFISIAEMCIYTITVLSSLYILIVLRAKSLQACDGTKVTL